MSRKLLLCLVTTSLIACEAPADPTAPSIDVVTAAARGGNGQGSMINGSGHGFRIDPLKDGGESLRDFTVSVTQGKNGVSGHMHLGSVASLRPGLSFIGEVTCATIVDNGDGTKDAWIGGINKHTNFDGNDLGAQFAVRIRDVGGAQAGPDRVSGVRFSGLINFPTVGDWACAATPGWWGMREIDAGNITIR